MSSPLVNICDHVINFSDTRVILRFATKYSTIQKTDEELILGHRINLIPLFEDKLIQRKDEDIIITFNKLPLFKNTTIKMFKQIVQLIFDKFSINFALDFKHNSFQFVSTMQECENLAAYDYNSVIGDYSIILTCDVKYDGEFDKQARVTSEIEQFYYDMMSLDYSKINSNQKYMGEKLKITVGHYPKERIKINLAELYLMIKTKLINGIENVSITYAPLNLYNNYKKSSTIISSKTPDPKTAKGEADSVVLIYNEPFIYSTTVYLDGTIITVHKTSEYTEQHANAAMKKINELELDEFEMHDRKSGGYTHSEASMCVKYNVDFELKTPPSFPADKYITIDKMTSKRFYYYATSFITEYKLYNVFRALISDVAINRIIFARRQKTNISIWTEGDQHYIQFNNLSYEDEALFIIRYLRLLMLKETYAQETIEKVPTAVNKDLKALQTVDPEVFGKLTINGKQTTYSKVVSHSYERPVLITEEDYLTALQLDPNSVIKMTNQTVKKGKIEELDKHYYLQCQDKDHDKIYFHVVDGQCLPKCTKIIRNVGQFNQCLEKLGITDTDPIRRSRNRILKYSPNIEIGSRCEPSKLMNKLFPNCYFIRFGIDDDTSVEKYITNLFNMRCIVLTEDETGIKIRDSSGINAAGINANGRDMNKKFTDKIIVFIPNYHLISRDGKNNDDLVYYLLCKNSKSKDLVPQLVTKEFDDIMKKAVNNDLKMLNCYDIDLGTEELIPVGIQDTKIGYYSQESNVVFPTPAKKDLNVTSLQTYPNATFPSIESIKNPRFISYDGKTCITTEDRKIPIHSDEEETKHYIKTVYDTNANFMYSVCPKKIQVDLIDSPYKINYTKILLQRFLVKGYKTLEDLKKANKIAQKTQIELVCNHIPSIVISKISEEDFNKYINKVDVFDYIYRIYKLEQQLGEFVIIY